MNKRLLIGVKINSTVNSISPKLEKFDYNIQRLHSINDIVESYIIKLGTELPITTTKEQYFDEFVFKTLHVYEQELYSAFIIESEHCKQIRGILRKNNNIRYVQWDNKNIEHSTPNDPDYSKQWALEKIDIEKAWKKGSRGRNVLIAIIDSGIDSSHPDLKDAMWKDSNGRDGYNFIENNYDTSDSTGHGTHVAGIIAARSHNRKYIVGVANKCEIMNLKFLPQGLDSAAVRAIKFAVDNGARIINNSWGPTKPQRINKAINEAIAYAYFKRVTVVFSAGNNNADIKKYSFIQHPYAIAVASTDKNDKKASDSNYGKDVTISAPGVNIISLAPNSSTTYKSGTSMAAPNVTGAIALLYELNPYIISPDYAKHYLKILGEWPDSKVPIGRRLNADYYVQRNNSYLRQYEKIIEYFYKGVQGCRHDALKHANRLSEKWFREVKKNQPGIEIFDKGYYTVQTTHNHGTRHNGARWCKAEIKFIAYILYWKV